MRSSTTLLYIVLCTGTLLAHGHHHSGNHGQGKGHHIHENSPGELGILVETLNSVFETYQLTTEQRVWT